MIKTHKFVYTLIDSPPALGEGVGGWGRRNGLAVAADAEETKMLQAGLEAVFGRHELTQGVQRRIRQLVDEAAARYSARRNVSGSLAVPQHPNILRAGML